MLNVIMGTCVTCLPWRFWDSSLDLRLFCRLSLVSRGGLILSFCHHNLLQTMDVWCPIEGSNLYHFHRGEAVDFGASSQIQVEDPLCSSPWSYTMPFSLP